MSSRYVKNLRQVAEELKKQGFPYSADVCFASAERMQRMEAYITVIHRDFIDTEMDADLLERYARAKAETSDADNQD